MLLVADVASGQLRLFNPKGELLRVIGSVGGGPGEHLRLSGAWFGGADSIISFDLFGRRLKVWTFDGRHQRDVPVNILTSSSAILGRLRNGSVVAVRLRPQGTQIPRASRIDSADVSIVLPDGGVVEVAELPWKTTHAAVTPSGSVVHTALPLYPQTIVGVGADDIYVGDATSWRINQYTSDGSLAKSLDLGIPRTRLSRKTREAWQAERLERVRITDRLRMKKYLDDLPYPTHLPAYDQMIVDDKGSLWIRHFAVPGAKLAQWTIVTNGKERPSLQLPANLKPFHIGEKFMVAVVSNENNVEEVRVLPVTR